MAVSITHSITVGGKTFTGVKTATGTGEQTVSDSFLNGADQEEFAFSLDVSEVEAFFALSNEDVTLETNSTGAPVDTILLKANVPFAWPNSREATFALLITTDITVIYVTNASGNTATVQIGSIYDATP